MKTFSSLKRVVPSEHALTSIFAQLQHQGYQPTFSRPLTNTRYLRFHAQFEDRAEIHGLLDLASWLKVSMPELDGIDWLSMEDQVLQPLIKEHPLHLALSHQHAPLVNVKIVEFVPAVKHTHDLPSLDATPGTILIEQYTPHIPTDVSEITALNELQIPLTFTIGYSTLPLSAVGTIEVGDVLLIERAEGHVSSNGKTLFTCELNQEAIMILNQTEDEMNHEPTEHNDNNGGINELPIELSVVLFEKTIPLNQFKAITPGEIIELPQSAMLDVEIRANRRSFARGELVQLPNGQLGVEVRTLWTKE